MGMARSTYGGQLYIRYWLENLSERHRLEDVSVGAEVILKWMVQK